ncbi:hypothetical protein SLEP1_g22412 [Rubroshorea leprosula]|uniref:Uncharacterized protein n=1 Tax=Rubroshorea leprosula TaxID=152421 RepID=A0AAV5JK06_9ROSI|nr:hypothetical protein SLEP1_g22412 [Rubroshorea leprosula]
MIIFFLFLKALFPLKSLWKQPESLKLFSMLLSFSFPPLSEAATVDLQHRILMVQGGSVTDT